MKNIICLLFSLMTVVALSAQDSHCEKYHNGRFEINDDQVGRSVIERRGDVQIEKAENSGLELKFDVVWLTDCKYTLQLNEILENPNGIDMEPFKDMILTVEIVGQLKNGYVQRSTSNMTDMVLETEMIRIPED
jgi:hypothetical protein